MLIILSTRNLIGRVIIKKSLEAVTRERPLITRKMSKADWTNKKPRNKAHLSGSA